jgi:hypothetical protein
MRFLFAKEASGLTLQITSPSPKALLLAKFGGLITLG